MSYEGTDIITLQFWYHAIDETNGIVANENGEVESYCIPVDLEILSPEVTEICQSCGHERTVHHPTYRIPLGVGVSLQTL